MRKTPTLFAVLTALGLVVSHGHEVADSMAAAANDFLNSLDEDQREKATFEFEDEERFNWHYVPIERVGLPLGEMRPEQQHLTHALLNSGLSHTGYGKAMQIMSLERILWELENQAPRRDAANYQVWIFGTPSAEGTWGWRFEGHHLSLNFTIVNGEMISETPAFWAANPGEVMEGPRAGLRVLAEEEDVARELIQSFSKKQKEMAIIADKAPKDILTAELPKVEHLGDEGIAWADLKQDQQEQLDQLIRVYLYNHRSQLADEELERVKSELDDLRFAWAGGLEPGEGHYYRVQGKTWLLEYDNVQNGAKHPHAVWRNFGEDFGRDLLREHHEKAHTEN